MSIQVDHISKLYGAQKALDDVSFSVGSSEVVGFLGPNGAGKSTMMKILTCFLPPSSGRATVCGFDTNNASMDVRRNVGYLPEHNPLYLDLYVREYLAFMAGIHGLRNKDARVREMIDMVGLGREQHKRIGQLSKGYRQRVGLAQEVRALIKDIGRAKTVMLSTHIMQEVEAICDRVIIIDRGKLVADDKASTLRSRSEHLQVLEVEFDVALEANVLLNIEGVTQARRGTGNTWMLAHHAGVDIRAAVFQFAVEQDHKVLGMQKSERALEDVFKELTRH